MTRFFAALALLGMGFQAPDIAGTWKLTDAKVKTNGPREIVIREDSSASWGKEHARWRLVPKDQIMIAVGGEWETYKVKVRGTKLTLSGGDLTDPVTLTKIGPATPRPSGVPVPPDPDAAPPR
jgi:hypothetical protein